MMCDLTFGEARSIQFKRHISILLGMLMCTQLSNGYGKLVARLNKKYSFGFFCKIG
jgi:hypothetical protein